MPDDIRLKYSFRMHRKRRRLQMRLGAAGPLALVDLWLAIAEQRPGGDLTGLTADDLEFEAGWSGEPGALVRALVEVGFLVRADDNALQLHGWHEHQAWLVGADIRSQAARKANAVRWVRNSETTAAPDPDPIRSGSAPDPDPIRSGSAPDPDPIRSGIPSSSPLPSLNSNTNTSEGSETGRRPENSSARRQKYSVTFNWESFQFEGITAEQQAHWGKAYPAVTIETELAAAAAWLQANPANRKTNYARFLVNWLARAQDRSPGRTQPLGAPGFALGQKHHERRPLRWN